jgi:hypothetical protein
MAHVTRCHEHGRRNVIALKKWVGAIEVVGVTIIERDYDGPLRNVSTPQCLNQLG